MPNYFMAQSSDFLESRAVAGQHRNDELQKVTASDKFAQIELKTSNLYVCKH